MARTVQLCRVVGVMSNTSVGCHRSSDAGGGEFESRYRPYFYAFLDARSQVLVFQQQILRFFEKSLKFFGKKAFPKNYAFSDVIETNFSLSKFLEN